MFIRTVFDHAFQYAELLVTWVIKDARIVEPDILGVPIILLFMVQIYWLDYMWKSYSCNPVLCDSINQEITVMRSSWFATLCTDSPLLLRFYPFWCSSGVLLNSFWNNVISFKFCMPVAVHRPMPSFEGIFNCLVEFCSIKQYHDKNNKSAYALKMFLNMAFLGINNINLLEHCAPHYILLTRSKKISVITHNPTRCYRVLFQSY